MNLLGLSTAQFGLHGDGLPIDVLVTSYLATEVMSEPYQVRVDFCTSDADFDVDGCLRKRMLLEVVNHQGARRWFDGVVAEVSFVAARAGKLHFSFEIRPALWALSYRVNSRIFQDESVLDIAQTLFTEAGFMDRVTFEVSGSYAPREYVVQYRESALNFVQRLFEEEGLFYFFVHDEDGHRMIVADAPAAFEQAGDPVPHSLSQGVLAFGEPLHSFSRRRALRCTHLTLRDYDFENPQVPPESELPADDRWPAVHFDYPGRFTAAAEGNVRASARLRQLRHDADVCEGRSEAPGLSVGARITVDGAAEDDLNGTYVLTEATTRGHQAVDDSSKNVSCDVSFRGVPEGTPYLPPRRARRPRIAGIQTAVVTGPAGSPSQSIHVDEYGRIKVRFFWDRVSQHDEHSSCWIRACQVPLGGSMILPRIGWEVSVAFLEGDPDRPVVLGRVYNGENAPPIALPAGRASGSLTSMSSPGGAGSNAITMCDTGGSQGFSIKAQKDLNMTTGHDQSEEVGVDDDTHIASNLSRSVGVNDTVNVGSNQSASVGAHSTLKVAGDQSITIGANDQHDAEANFLEQIAGSRSQMVAGNQTTISNGERRNVQGTFARKVGAVELTAAVGAIAENYLATSSSSVGAVRVHVTGGSHGEVVAGAKARTIAGAEVQIVKGDDSNSSDGATTRLVGAAHNQKIGGDYVVKGLVVSVLGANAKLKAGGSEVTLAGGPITLKGSKIQVKAGLIKKTGGQLKVGG